jgi:hypothetical protein
LPLEMLMTVSGFAFDVFTGESNKDQRMEMVDRFQDPQKDYSAMLISTQAGGVGLNLTAANKVVIFDPDWSGCSGQGFADEKIPRTIFRQWIGLSASVNSALCS